MRYHVFSIKNRFPGLKSNLSQLWSSGKMDRRTNRLPSPVTETSKESWNSSRRTPRIHGLSLTLAQLPNRRICDFIENKKIPSHIIIKKKNLINDGYFCLPQIVIGNVWLLKFAQRFPAIVFPPTVNLLLSPWSFRTRLRSLNTVNSITQLLGSQFGKFRSKVCKSLQLTGPRIIRFSLGATTGPFMCFD